MTRRAHEQGRERRADDVPGPEVETPTRPPNLTELVLIITLIAVVTGLALVFLDDALAELLSIVGESVE